MARCTVGRSMVSSVLVRPSGWRVAVVVVVVAAVVVVAVVVVVVVVTAVYL